MGQAWSLTSFLTCPGEVDFFFSSVSIRNDLNYPYPVSMSMSRGFPHSSVGKESACNAEDLGSIPGLGRFSGEGKGYPLSGLENSTECIVHGVAKSRTRLNDFYQTLATTILSVQSLSHV